MIEAVAEVGSCGGVGLGLVWVANAVFFGRQILSFTIYYYIPTPSEDLFLSLVNFSSGSARFGIYCCFHMAVTELGACGSCMASGDSSAVGGAKKLCTILS